MVNVKEKVYRAIKDILNDVTDSWPQDWADSGRIIYTEEENKSYERSGAKTLKSYCRYRIDILMNESTSVIAGMVDAALACDSENHGLGMTRTMCTDDNNGSKKHKIMRYECIVDETNERIYGIS